MQQIKLKIQTISLMKSKKKIQAPIRALRPKKWDTVSLL